MLDRRQFLAALAAGALAPPLFRPAAARATTYPAVGPESVRHAVVNFDAGAADAVRDRLGEYGLLSIRTRDRLDDLVAALEMLGWKKPKDFGVGSETDWKTGGVLAIFNRGEGAERIALGGYHVPSVDVLITRTPGVDRPTPDAYLLFVDLPLQQSFITNVRTAATPNVADKDRRPEWHGTVGPADGDAVGGLRGRITAAAEKLKVGQDILLEFELRLSAGDLVQGVFSRKPTGVRVWDGKYSNGYRNHAFHVVRPDGTVVVLRPPAKAFGKNAPHPVSVAEGKPYVLPEWFEGKTFKSLADLGLKTDQPGTYAVTGIYAQHAAAGLVHGRDDGPMWTGELWTNTVVVEVK